MRIIHPPVFECEVCGQTSTDQALIERCEAKGPATTDVVGKIGFVNRVETDWTGSEPVQHEWLVQVRITATTARKHDTVCTVEVLPWPKDDHFHKSTLHILADDVDWVMLDEIEFNQEAAETALLT